MQDFATMLSQAGSTAGQPSRATWRILVLCGVAVTGLAYALYQPAHYRPFDILDFSEFLPLLSRENSFGDQLGAVFQYYLLDQGRWVPLPYLALTAKWSLFGDTVVAWQVLRFIQMLAITAGVFVVLRSLDASVAGAVWGALLFVTGTAAATAWLRLTMGEPLGLMFLLAALIPACVYQQTSRWKHRSIWIAICLTGMVLCKETLVFAVPFALSIAWCRQGAHSYDWPRASARNVRLLSVTALALTPAGLAIIWVARSAKGGSFASLYGDGMLSLDNLLIRFVALLLPSWPGVQPSGGILAANLAFLSVVVYGWQRRLKTPQSALGDRLLLPIILALPAGGAIAYWPWPMFETFYGLPFLLAPALLLALAVTAAGQSASGSKWVHPACGVVLAVTALQAHRTARITAARQEINYELAVELSRLQPSDSVFVAHPRAFPESWRGPGPALRRYGGLFGRNSAMPSVTNVTCDAIDDVAGSATAGGARVLISSNITCGLLPRATRVIQRGVTYYDLGHLRLRRDSIRADLMSMSVPGGVGDGTDAGRLRVNPPPNSEAPEAFPPDCPAGQRPERRESARQSPHQ